MASNNEAEYKVLIIGLKIVKELDTPRFKVFSNSQLVVRQVNREFEAQSPSMARYLGKVKEVKAKILNCSPTDPVV